MHTTYSSSKSVFIVNTGPKTDNYRIGKQNTKQDLAFVVLKPATLRLFFSVPKPAGAAKKMRFSHTALDRRHEASPRRARIMTKLGGCMLH